MSDSRDEQIKWLADRLALAVSFISDVEMDVVFEQDEDEPNRFSEAKHMVLSDLETFETQRTKRRKTVFYEMATNDIRARLRGALRARAA